MRSLVCALVLVVACSKPGGVVFVIHAGPIHDVATVRVFIGLSTIDNVDSLTVPDGASTATRTNNPTVAARDPGDGGLVHAYSDGVSFELQTGDSGLTNLPAAIVVGYAADGSAIGAALVQNVELHATDEVDKHDVTLSSVDLSAPAGSGAGQIFLWGPDGPAGTDAECVGLVSTDNPPTFIVAADDTDCDGFANMSDKECDPLYFMDKNGTASLQNPTCLITSPDGTECKLGAEQCIDGIGPVDGGECMATGICMPLMDCGCPDDDLQCLIDHANDNSYLGYHCSIGTKGMCTIPLPRPPTGGLACKPIDATNSNTGIASMGDGNFSDSIQLGNTMYKLDVTTDCAVTLTPAADAMTNTEEGALLRIDLSNGASLLSPIDFTFMGSMCGQSTCETFAFDDPGLTACMAGWQPGTPVAVGPGRSPTLLGDMSQMLFLSVDGHVYLTMHTLNGWSPPQMVPDLAALTFLQVHLSRDGTILYAIDTTHTLVQFVQSSGKWNVGVGQGTLAAPDWFSPDNLNDDAVIAAMDELSEAVPMFPGGPYSTSTSIGSGSTPFLSDNALDLYYADDPQANSYVLFVSSRTDATMPFPATGVPIVELGPSSEPQSPWVSPDSRTMFYVVDSAADGSMPTIYMTTR